MDLTNGHMRLDQSRDISLMREVSLRQSYALKIIMDRYMSMVSRTAYRIMCDRPDSEAVTKEVFIKVWMRLHMMTATACPHGFTGSHATSASAVCVDAASWFFSPSVLRSMSRQLLQQCLLKKTS